MVSDTETQVSQDATQGQEVTEPDAVEVAASFLDTLATQDSSSTETSTPDTETVVSQDETPQGAKSVLDEYAASAAEEAAEKARVEERERVAAETKAKAEADEAENWQRGVQTSFRERATNLRSWAQDQNLSPEATEQLLNEFNQHHGQIAPYTALTYVNGFYDAAAKRLPEAERQAFLDNRKNLKGLDDFLGDFSERLSKHSQTGRFTAAERDKAVRSGKAELLLAIQANPQLYLSQINGLQSRTGGASAGAGGWLTLEQIDAMPTAEWLAHDKEWRDAQNAHARGQQ